jgi:hypothetical protein
MRRRPFIKTTLCVAAALALLLVTGATAQDASKKPDDTQVSGRVVRVLKDSSTIMIQRDTRQTNILYDAKTKFTFRNEPSSIEEVKEGRRVICRVKANDKNQSLATRIDVREK